MPKKQPHNAFYYFMLDYKSRCERNGERFPRGLQDVQEPAGDEWKVLPASMRKPYEDRAKEEKLKGKHDLRGKVTSLHNSFAYIDKRQREEEMEKQRRDAWIEGTLQSLSHEKSSLADHRFYVIHVNYLIVSQAGHYHAVELAMAEFCLSQGVTNTYHTFIDPGELPVGYSLDANIKSDQSHKINPADRIMGEKDKYKIFCSIKAFLEPGRAFEGNYPPMFTMQDNVANNTSMSCVQNLIEVMCENAGEDPDQFRVYPVDKLFYNLKNAAAQFEDVEGFPTPGFAINELERDVNSYVFQIACEFHQDKDAVQFCSLSYVQRWVYLMCDHCCEYVDIVQVPGKHCPVTTDVHFLPQQVRKNQAQASKPPEPAPFTWVDHTKPVKSNWNPVEPPPLPRPTRQSLPVGLSTNRFENLQVSEDNFPAISIGRGRGSRITQPNPGKPFNYAAAMKKK